MKTEEIYQILKNKTVGIAGCGGLGSNCAVSLARVFVGKLIIADFDVIEASNLNRQYYFQDQIGKKKAYTLKENINKINPEVQVTAHDILLQPKDILELFKDCDVIVEAFDKKEMKEMIIETVLTKLPEKHLVIGSGMAGWGNNNTIVTKSIGNLHICGDEFSEVSVDNPPLSPRVGIVSHMQANKVVELLMSSK